MNRNVLLVALGSMLGGVARYICSLQIAERYVTEFPYGTFVVNLVGCFLVGCFYGLAERFEWFSPDLRLMLTVGFCGGFTTFSSFAYENVRLLQERDYTTFGSYALLSVVIGLLAAFAGLSLSKA
ncbi:MAG TPA: fluoride efflux transporter CrcB [Pyrinomonadaceae bacterium]|nr:fluoride efflux transporter CrcB [Pyrinomonadaceae bacterium]